MANEAESGRIAAQASQSVQQHQLAVAQEEAQDAAVDVEVLRNASVHLGTQKVLQSLLLGAQAEERRQRQRVALAQAPQRGNTTLLEKQYHEKREAISQVLQQRSTATRSLEVLTAALEDESGYLADLQMTCELAKVAYKRAEAGHSADAGANDQNEPDSPAAPDQASQAPRAIAKAELPTKPDETEEQPATAAKVVQQQTTAVKAVVHHRKKPALRSGARLAQKAVKHVAPAPRLRAKLRAAAKAAAKSHPEGATVALAGVHKEPTEHKGPTAASAGKPKEAVAASSVAHTEPKVVTAAKEATAASAGVRKASSTASTAKTSSAASAGASEGSTAAAAAKETSAAPGVVGEALTAVPIAKTSAAASAGAGEGSTATSAAKTSTDSSATTAAGAGEDSNEASAGDSEEPAAAAPAADSKESTAASASENKEPTTASGGVRKESTAAPAGNQKVVLASAGAHKEQKKPKAAASVSEVFDGGMPSEYTAWTPDGSAPTPPPDKDFEGSPTKHMMALLGDSDDEAPHAEAKPAAQGKGKAKSVHAAVSPSASHASADKPQPVHAAKPQPAAQAKAGLAAPAQKAATTDATADAPADATADLTTDSSTDSVETKVEPAAPEAEHAAATTDSSAPADPKAETAAPEVEHTAATADDGAAAEPKAVPALQKAPEPVDGTATAREEAGARAQPQAAQEMSVGANHGHDVPDKAATQVSFASDDAVDHAFPAPSKHHRLSALETKHEGNLPTQYDAWDPSEEKPVVRGETSLEQMVADFRNDDEEEQEQAKPRGKKLSFKKPPPPPKVEAEANVVYDDDDLPKHRRRPVFTELQGGWKSFIAKNAASKPHKPKLDPDLVIMNSLYSTDGGLPQQYTAWTPGAPSFLQRPADASAAAAAVLEQFGAALRSDSLRKLARTQPPRTELAALWQRLQPLTQRQSQAQRWCLYFQQHAQTAEPVRAAVSRAEDAGNALAAASAQRAAMAEEMNARTQLLRTVEQDVHGLTELLNVTQGVEEVADALRATLTRRSAVLAAQQQQLAELRKAIRAEDGTVGQKRAAQALAQKGIAAARKKLAGIQLGCDAALRSLQHQEHSGHMEAHAIEVALQVFAGKE